MSELEKLLREEAEHAEQNKDATPSGDAKIGRPGRDRAKVLSVRLNAKEYEQLTAQAELAGLESAPIGSSDGVRRAVNVGGTGRWIIEGLLTVRR